MKNTFRILFSVLAVASVTLFATGCRDKETLPSVTTVAVSDIDLASAVGGGTITDDGGSTITGRGVCWSTSENPTIDDFTVADQTDGDGFTVNMSSLKWATKYYVRAYATNSEGTAYGESVSFTTVTPKALVYIDQSNRDDRIEEALTAQRCDVTSSPNSASFATSIASGDYNLVVLFTQSMETSYYSEVTTSIISSYLATGGAMIYATYSLNDDEYAALFNASFSGNTNLETVTFTDQLLISEAGFNTVALSNPGWGTFSTGLAASTGGTVLATFENGHAAMVLGNEGHTMMLGYLSDAPTANNQELFESVLVKLNASL